jgi:tetratricopeptide (TPR) repeat protein
MLKRLFADLLGRRRGATDAPHDADANDPFARLARLLEVRDVDRAAAALPAARERHPEDPRTHFFEGEILRLQDDCARAVQAYRRSLLLEPLRTDAWIGMGDCHARTGDALQAFVHYRTALSLDPDRVDALNELGLISLSLANNSDAAEAFERAVGIDPGHAEAWNNLGLVLASRGSIARARHCFHRATHLRPGFYTALCNLGLACRDLGRLDESAQALRQAAELEPEKPTAWDNIAATLQDAGELDGALAALEQALAVAPRSVSALTAKGVLLGRLGKPDGARDALEAALAIDPANADAGLGLAHLDLSCGSYASGWDRYDSRLRASQSPRQRFPHVEWDGAQPVGSVMVYAEQGLGDTILFASCLPDLFRHVPQCYIHCEDRLWPILQRSFPGLHRYEPSSPSGVDAYAPIGSLPRLYRRADTDFPERASYLQADPERISQVQSRLAALGNGPKVAIAWRGGLQATGRAMRSLELAGLRALLSCQGVAWISLQRGDAAAEIEAFASETGIRVHTLGDVGDDVENAAAIIRAVDLVVTVCCSVVHLAGALGRETWVLTPEVPAWRYRFEGDTMPWYPAVRLFRQQAGGGWQPVVGRLRSELERRVSAREVSR